MDKLQWGNRKRLRCVKVKESTVVNGNGIILKKKITSQRGDRTVVNEQDPHHPLPPLHASSPQRLNRKIMSALSSPEKEDRYYTTRGSAVGGVEESSSSKKVLTVDTKKETKRAVWPKLFTTLSSKEKEEDFMAMKGCKLPQRPKKRAKIIQRTLLLVSPGAWLSDLCQERYEVTLSSRVSFKGGKREKGRELKNICVLELFLRKERKGRGGKGRENAGEFLSIPFLPNVGGKGRKESLSLLSDKNTPS